MAKFVSKADSAFRIKLERLLTPPILQDSEGVWRPKAIDWSAVERLFMCYGYYLELIDPEIDMTTADVKERLKL